MTEENSKTELPGWIMEHVQQYRADPDKGHMWDSTFAGGPGLLPHPAVEHHGPKIGADQCAAADL